MINHICMYTFTCSFTASMSVCGMSVDAYNTRCVRKCECMCVRVHAYSLSKAHSSADILTEQGSWKRNMDS
jgi:hypothetical protein